MNAVVPEIVGVAKLRPGAPVVSISTYVELSVCAIGVAEFDGVARGVPLTVLEPVAVPLGLFDGVPERVLGGVPVAEAPSDAVPVGVSLAVREPLGVIEPVPVLERLRVPDFEVVTVDVPDNEEPTEAVRVIVSLPLGAAPVGDPLTDRVTDREGVFDGVLLGVAVGVAVGDLVALADAVAERELPWDAVHVADGVLDPVSVPDSVLDAELERVPVCVGDRVLELEDVLDVEGDTVLVAERDEPEDAVPVSVPVLEGVPEGVPLVERVGDGVGVVVYVGETVRVPVCDLVPLLDALAAMGITNSPCVARPVPKLLKTSDCPQHHTPALLCRAQTWVPPTILTSM